MRRFRKILVAISASDPSDTPNSLLHAVKLAQNTGAQLHIAGVIPQLQNYLRSWRREDPDAEEFATRRLENRLSKLCEGEAGELEYTVSILRGRPFVELIREAQQTDCDLIVMSAANDAGQPLLGSVEFRLMQNSPIPVWIVKSKPVPLYERVLVAIDPFAETDEETGVNLVLLELASSLAEWERADLYVVSACEVRGAELLIGSLGADQFEQYVQQVSARGKESLNKVLSNLRKPLPENHVKYQEGIPAEVIVDFAEEIDADIILMGTLTRSSIVNLMIGNTASEVLRRVRHSVMTIKPGGFQSPVS